MQLYDRDWLSQARRTLGTTDMWVTYSWGFADHTEQQDRAFILDHLENFRATGIRAHAYVQGLNVVTAEFPDSEFFCRDLHGRRLPYSRGRSFICPNHPDTQQLVLDRVQAAAQENFAGVFVDNILFGLPPWRVSERSVSFFGCACEHCQHAFEAQFGGSFPRTSRQRRRRLPELLQFRIDSIRRFIEPLSAVTRAAGKEFGINLYDPHLYTPELYFGFTVDSLADLLDYLLIENHSLPSRPGRHNRGLQPLIEQYRDSHSIFVVSYHHGIGWERAYDQTDVDAVWAESHQLGYDPCLKATEFLTDKTWHALDITSLAIPETSELEILTAAETLDLDTLPPRTARPNLFVSPVVDFFDRWYSWLVTQYFERPLANRMVDTLKLYQRQLAAPHRHNLWTDSETPESNTL